MTLASDSPGTGAFATWARVLALFAEDGAQAYVDVATAAMADPELASCPNPLAALHAMRMAAFAGEAHDPFDGDGEAFCQDYRRQRARVDAAVARGLVQFTDPLRLADTLPALLLASRRYDGRPLRLIELGASAGFLLSAEQFNIEYPTGSWTPSGATGTLVSDLYVPEDLLAQRLEIADRVGVDLAPVDPADPGTYDYLRGFIWPGDASRQSRLYSALQVLSERPAPVVRGDVLAELPALLGGHKDAVNVVIESGVSAYLPGRSALRLGMMLDSAAHQGPVVLVSRGRLNRADAQDLKYSVTFLDMSRRWHLACSVSNMCSDRTQWIAAPEDLREEVRHDRLHPRGVGSEHPSARG